MKMNKIYATVLITGLALTVNVFGQIAEDSAGNYTDWIGDPSLNEGYGFEAWTFDQQTGTGFAGRFIGDTAVGDTSFGLFSGDDATAFSSAFRKFDNPLGVGDTFSVNLGHTGANFGEIGLNLINNGTIVYTLKLVSGETTWEMNDGGTDFGIAQDFEADTSIPFSFTYNGGSSYSYSFGSASGNNFIANSDISSIDEVGFFNRDQGGGQNIGFNNLTVIPEPSSIIMVGLTGLAAAGLTLLKRRRKA